VASKTADKVGRGLTKLKHGVLGRSEEGLVDPPDTALDLADFCDVRIALKDDSFI
jgi:hypothetical protein